MFNSKATISCLSSYLPVCPSFCPCHCFIFGTLLIEIHCQLRIVSTKPEARLNMSILSLSLLFSSFFLSVFLSTYLSMFKLIFQTNLLQLDSIKKTKTFLTKLVGRDILLNWNFELNSVSWVLAISIESVPMLVVIRMELRCTVVSHISLKITTRCQP